MLKWLGGCLIVVVVLIAAGSWFAMRAMKESLGPDGSARVAVHASPDRVFASLADGDSAATWMGPGNAVKTSRRGPYQPGDSVRIEMRGALGMKAQPMIWTVKQVVPGRLLVLDLTTRDYPGVIASRRDSLFQIGDSTIVISNLVSNLADSTKGRASAEMMISMFRLQSKLELESLKGRIEGPARPRQ